MRHINNCKIVELPVTTPSTVAASKELKNVPPYIDPSIIKQVPAAAHASDDVITPSKRYESGIPPGLVSDKFMVQCPVI